MEILLLGDIVIDRSFFGISTRIAPEGPVPIVKILDTRKSFGCIGNILQSCKPFFKKIYLPMTFDSNDNETIESLKYINSETNIQAINFHQENRKIITKNRVFSNNRIIARYDQEEINEIDSNICKEITNFVKKIIPTLNIILISDYRKGFLSDILISNIIELANNSNIPVIVDPKGQNYDR
jgi:D-beta-D-heptose 7-phosphate kinase/D-beta-D-heptose 1-phosphate adenosyltransferase